MTAVPAAALLPRPGWCDACAAGLVNDHGCRAAATESEALARLGARR